MIFKISKVKNKYKNKNSSLTILLSIAAMLFINSSIFTQDAQDGMGAMPNIDLVDTPTAETLGRGSYGFAFTGYTRGGILTKGLVGLHEKLYFGVSFDVAKAIGHEAVKFYVPGAIAKIKITEGTESFPFKTAIGYDTFYAGPRGKINNTYNPFEQALYGPYFVLSRPMWMFGMEQNFSFGVRMPAQPYYLPDDTSLFLGLEVPIESFYLLLEAERIYFDTNRLQETLFNAGFRYVLFDKFAVELDFMMGLHTITNRYLVFEYRDRF